MPPLHSGPIRSDKLDGTLNGYQRATQLTAIYPGRGSFWGLVYTALKGAGEAGEFAEKVGKLMRDHGLQPDSQINPGLSPFSESELSEDQRTSLALELGDDLWYVAAKAFELGYTLEEIATLNIEKLTSRQQRGTLSGSGDNR